MRLTKSGAHRQRRGATQDIQVEPASAIDSDGIQFRFRIQEGEGPIFVKIHADDFVRVAHMMKLSNAQAFQDAFAKAILGIDYD